MSSASSGSSRSSGSHGPRPPEAVGALVGVRIGWVPFSYEPHVPSTRLRSLLPVEALRAAGVDAEVLAPGGHGDHDCVVFQKAYRPRDLAAARRLRAAGTRIVFDLCDNHFHNPDDRPDLAERAERLREIVDLADLVTVSSPTLAEVVGREVVVVDDALEQPGVPWWARARAARRRARLRPPVRLVWFGHWGTERPSSGLPHLAPILPELERIDREVPLRLTVISNSPEKFDEYLGSTSVPTRFVEWSQRSFGRRFVGHDLCVLPITVNPLTVHKTSNRVRTALLLGLPVVADEIPAYREFAPWISFGDWQGSVRRLLEDPAAEHARVRAAQEHIRVTYTQDHLVGQWAAALRSALDG